MNAPVPLLSPSEAATKLGVSAKALRLYEQRGMLAPIRNVSGWRFFGPLQIARAEEIANLRALGLSLAEVSRVLEGDAKGLEPALADHQKILEGRALQLAETIEKVRRLRGDLARGQTPAPAEIARLMRTASAIAVAFELPWPWGGERFELRDIQPLTYIVGPLGSGKTRLAKRLSELLPNASFVGLERLADGGEDAQLRMAADPALKSRVDQALAWLLEDGAKVSAALVALLVALEGGGSRLLVVDMPEQGLDRATQESLISYLRRRANEAPPLFCLTRSNAILDLGNVCPNEAIILCPANHSPPTLVAPHRGAPGYEAVATCLAAPEVRARTEGVIAWRPEMA